MARILSIEFDNVNLRIIEGKRKGSTLNILNSIIVKVPLYSIDDGYINDDDKIKSVIKQVIKEHKMKFTKCIFAINTSSLLVRKLELPDLKKNKEVMSMIKIDLEQQLSIDLSQYEIIFKKSKKYIIDGLKKITYIVYCIPSKMYLQYNELAEELKLPLISMDVSSNYLELVFLNNLTINNNIANPKNSVGFINLGKNAISFSIIKNNINIFTKTYHCLDNKLEGVAETPILYETSKDILKYEFNQYMEEISKYIRYYYSINNYNQIDKIYLFGSYSMDVSEEFFDSIDIPVELVTNISNVYLLEETEDNNKSLLSNEYLHGIVSLFSDKTHLDFHTKRRRQIKFKFILSINILILITILILNISFKGIFNYFKNAEFKREIQTMCLFINENNKINNEIEEIKNSIERMKLYKNEVKKLNEIVRKNDNINSQMFTELASVIPYGTQVKSVIVVNKNIQIQCFSSSLDELSLLLKGIRNIDFIVDVNVPNIDVKLQQQGVDIKYFYYIICNIEDVVQN
ncbi:type IV pilus biogenesis protein PilM [Sedimentibacter sp. MB31-C6]|uniref:type IV pilus biogenesis protein PilM n=1 Tax=Sedimentibacter sp. MB31-C6 TaxID=3109366 RepID=UPI002DDCBA71|nr:pilus assembly protein PilM [Sedimentibacter sp. MB36-C1]WSI03807.1 pilus assembly protein PilM [Sedimentibacter sp. MB36-C1]